MHDMKLQHFDRRSALRRLAAVPLFTAVAAARAQAWPNRLVTMIVPWPAGNPTDAFARRMQPMVAAALGQAVVVDNAPGAGGTLGASRVASAPADGHTVLVSTPTELILSPLTMQSARYKTADFRMVGLFGRVPYVLVGRPDLPEPSTGELLASRARAGADTVSYGSIGNGTLIHLISAQFARATRLPTLHVPYQGVPPMIQALLASQIDIGFLPLTTGINDYIAQGKLRGLGITATQPYPLFPQLPALAAGSPALKGFEYDVWAGLHVHRTVPLAIAERWNALFYEITADADFRAWARGTGTLLLPRMSLAELQAFYEREAQQYQAIAKSVNLTTG